MRKKLLSISSEIDNYTSFIKYQSKGTNLGKLNEYKDGLRKIIDNELTEKQRFCFYQRYYENQSVKEISNILGIADATVYKHIRNAMKTIKSFVAIYGDEYFK